MVLALTICSLTQSQAAEVATSPTLALPEPGTARELTATEYEQLPGVKKEPLLLVNFWATWCVPCVTELPHFVKAHAAFASKGVQFVGVSLDFLDEREKTVEPFLKKHQIPYPNFILNADQDAFLKKFPKEWSGELPATFLYDRTGNLLDYHLGAMSEEQLVQLIEKHAKTLE